MLPYLMKRIYLKIKTIVENFEGSSILVSQAKVSLQTTGITTQFLKIKDQYECLVKLVETMTSANYIINTRITAFSTYRQSPRAVKMTVCLIAALKMLNN